MIKTSKGGKNVNRKFYYSKGFTVRDNFVTTLVEITVVTLLLWRRLHTPWNQHSLEGQGLRRPLLEVRTTLKRFDLE